jgi:hypothetical protein
MAGVASPTWAEVQDMDDAVLTAIGIIKGQQFGDTFIFDHSEVDKDGVTRYGIWKSTLDERANKNQGRVLPPR